MDPRIAPGISKLCIVTNDITVPSNTEERFTTLGNLKEHQKRVDHIVDSDY